MFKLVISSTIWLIFSSFSFSFWTFLFGSLNIFSIVLSNNFCSSIFSCISPLFKVLSLSTFAFILFAYDFILSKLFNNFSNLLIYISFFGSFFSSLNFFILSNTFFLSLSFKLFIILDWFLIFSSFWISSKYSLLVFGTISLSSLFTSFGGFSNISLINTLDIFNKFSSGKFFSLLL